MPCQKIQVDFVEKQEIKISFTIPGANLANEVKVNTARNTGTVSVHEDVDHSTPPVDGQVLMWDDTIPAYRPRIKHKLDATTTPGAGDDDADGFEIGSRWIDTVLEKEYVCTDASTGAANWVETTGSGAGVGDMTKAVYDTDNDGAIDLEAGGLDADVSAYEGLPIIESGAVSELKVNRTATTAPGASDDDTAGYSVGSIWIDVTGDEVYFCVDASTGAAIWKQVQDGDMLKSVYDPDSDGIVTASLLITDGGANTVTASQARSHIDDAAKHREINDAGSGTTDLWSADKISTELSGKANTSHNHNASDINAGTLAHERGGLEADVSAYDGILRISGGATSEIKCNLGASTAPGSSDDSSAGYSLLSFWLDTTADKAYLCIDPTTSAAVWIYVGSATGFLEAVVDDTSPKLGGDLDLNSNEIKVQRYATTGEQIGFYSSTTLLGYIRYDTGVLTISGPQLLKLDALSEIELNGGLSGVDINAPFGGVTIDGGGVDGVKLQGLKYPASDGAAGQYLKTDGAGTLSFDTPSISVPTASETVEGIAEIATQAETDAGADDARIVTPAKLAASYAGKKSVMLIFLGAGLDATTGDGKVKLQIPEDLDGMDLVTAKGHVDGSGTTGTMDITLYNETQTVDILSAAISIASGGTDATGTINASNAGVTEGDIISVNVDSIHTSPATGLGWVILTFKLP